MKATAILTVMAAVLATGFSAAAAPDLLVLPSDVRGVVMFPDGETPADGLRVRVWNADTEEVVFKTRTDKNGAFGIPQLDTGNHYVTVGPVRIDMEIMAARAGITPQPHGMVVVIPKRMPVSPIVPTGAAAATIPQVVSP